MKDIKYIYKNTLVTLLSQIIRILLGFILQRVFINTLGVKYLGYNSVYSNILQMLNLADLGVGVAVTSFLYKPLAENNKTKIKALMYLYKKIYFIIAFVVLFAGSLITILIPAIIKDAECSNYYLRIYFIINLVAVVSTYFFSYKRTLLIAEEKSYFTNYVDMILNIICSVVQIIALYIFSDFVIYLVINVIKNIISNLIISRECDKKHIFLKGNIAQDEVEKYKRAIGIYVKDLFISRIGAYIYYSTDNIIISIFKGSLLAGYLSNYTLVTTSIQSIVTQLFSALQATFGKLIVKENSLEKQKEIVDEYFFINYNVSNICALCSCFLIQPFIMLYIGKKYILNDSTIFFLSINLGLTLLLIIPSQVFIVYNLYKYDKQIIALSAFMNIVISSILVEKIGIDGALIGTLITSLVYLFGRLFIISRKIFDIPYRYYIKKIILWIINSSTGFVGCYFVYRLIDITSWTKLIISAFIYPILVVFISIFIMHRSKEYIIFQKIILQNLVKIRGNKRFK